MKHHLRFQLSYNPTVGFFVSKLSSLRGFRGQHQQQQLLQESDFEFYFNLILLHQLVSLNFFITMEEVTEKNKKTRSIIRSIRK